MRLSLRTRRKGVRPSFVATHVSPPSVDRQLVRPLSRFSESALSADSVVGDLQMQRMVALITQRLFLWAAHVVVASLR